MAKKNHVNVKMKPTYKLHKCGAITCINNIEGFCDCDKCKFYERMLSQEY